MKINLETLILSSYDDNNKNHRLFKYGLSNDTEFQKYFGQFFMKNIDEIFAESESLEINKAYLIEEEKEVIGMIRIFEKRSNSINLQYAVSKEYRRLGYGKKILEEVTNFFIRVENIDCIKLDIDKYNNGSIKCAESLDFVKDTNGIYSKNR